MAALRTVVILITALCWGAATAYARERTSSLTVSAEGILLKDAIPYRGIGVNYFDLFYHLLHDPNDRDFGRDLERLAADGIPFVRFAANGFWPVDNQLYFRHPKTYFRLLDRVVRAAERNGVGLIPSLFWNVATVPDLAHEPLSAWGDPASRTRRLMRNYTREVVKRYRRSPAIWAWEFGNEYNDFVDLPNLDKFRPPVQPALGTPPSRSEKDYLTSDMLVDAFEEFSATLRKLDPIRPISSGNDITREDAFHRHRSAQGEIDTQEQWTAMLSRENAPFTLISVHVYLNRTRKFFADDPADVPEVIGSLPRIVGPKPVFIGEFGPSADDKESGGQQFRTLLAAIESSGVPLAALWNFGPRRLGAGTDWNINFENENAWMLKEIAAVNARIRTRPEQHARGANHSRYVVLWRKEHHVSDP